MSLIETLRNRRSFLITAEVMELLRLRRNTVCTWVKDGNLPATRTASGYRFDPIALADWLVARSTGTARTGA